MREGTSQTYPNPTRFPHAAMSYYEEVELEDLDYNAKTQTYTYPCPCGDTFVIGLDELWDGEDVAPCPSCTLRILVIFEESDLPEWEERSEEEEENEDGDDNEVQEIHTAADSEVAALVEVLTTTSIASENKTPELLPSS